MLEAVRIQIAERDNLGGNPFVLAYTRISVTNNSAATVTVPPGGSGPNLVRLTAVNDSVAAGQTIAVLESMKMETAVRAPFAGRVREVLAGANAQVDAGAPLLALERAGEDARGAEDDG